MTGPIQSTLSRRTLLWGVAAAGAAHAIPARAADKYPTKPVRIIVPFAAGGNNDVLARGVAARLTERWGQQVLVENRAGATGQVGTEYAARAPADGYTLLVTSEGTLVINPSLFSNLPYDPEKDFVPIARLVDLKQALVVNSSVPIKSIPDLLALAKKEAGKLTYGTNGVGSSSHLNMELLQSMAGVTLTPVHYRGAGQALSDLYAGHIQMMFLGAGVVAQHHREGKLRIIATGSITPLADMPEIPTIAQTLPGFDGTSWFGMFAPRATPPEIVQKIYKDIQQIFDDRSFHEKFLKPAMLEANVTSPEESTKAIYEGREKWGKVIRDAKLEVK